MQKLSVLLLSTILAILFSSLLPPTTAQSNEISVKSYGAVGDGVTDDTEAIIEAVAALVSSASYLTSNILFFPEGTYLLSSSLPDNLTAYITIPEQPSYNQHYNYWILGTDEGSTEIIWNPSEGGLFSIESSINNLGGQIVLSKLSIRTTQAVSLNQNQVMFWSFGIPLVYVNQIDYQGQSENDTVTVFAIGAGGPSSSFELGSPDGFLNAENANRYLQVSDFTYTVIGGVQLNNIAQGFQWKSTTSPIGSVTPSISMHSVFYTNYRTAIEIHGFGLTQTSTYSTSIDNSVFTCGDKDAPGAFACDWTLYSYAAGNIQINNVTFNDPSYHVIHLQPTAGTIGVTNSTFNGGATAFRPTYVTGFTLDDNTFNSPFSSSAAVLVSGSFQPQPQMTIMNNVCSGTGAQFKLSCPVAWCRMSGNQGCTVI